MKPMRAIPAWTQKDSRRFWSLVTRTDTCWLWDGALSGLGYGSFKFGTTSYRAHRVAYTWLVGAIPEGLVLDHLCRVHHCVNPEHLEPVTPRVNVLRGVTMPARSVTQTHCHRGHELVGDNLYIKPNGNRDCRACKRRRDAARRNPVVVATTNGGTR